MSLIPKSALKRSFILLKTATRLAAKETGKKLKETLQDKFDENAPELIKLRVEQTRILTENLSQLKGAAMKLGQLISLDAADFLPKEAQQILAQLYNKSAPVDFSQMKKVMLQELGEEKFSKIKNIDLDNVFSASIGQVYKAEIDGRPVALKVQYPGISDSIESDIQILKNISAPMLKLTGRKMDMSETFEELKIMLKLEVDYIHERLCLEEFGELIADNPSYLIPKTLPEYCSQKVLCMSWEEGLMFSNWLESSPTQEDKNTLAKLMLELYVLEFFKWGFVQTDPNFGNFLVLENPIRLVLLDFGATKKYELSFVKKYKELLKTFEKGNFTEVMEKSFDFGLIDKRESHAAQESYYHMLLVTMEPFEKERQPFDFSDKAYSKRTKEAVMKFTALLKYSPPPRDIIFLHRKLGGVFNFIRIMKVQTDITQYWEKMIEA